MTQTQTWFRVQHADRDVCELLDSGYCFSHAWSGDPGDTREGVSVCATLAELAEYLASPISAAITVGEGNWMIVELAGDPIPGARPIDPEYEHLVRPSAIVAVRPVDDEFLAMIAAASAWLDSFVANDFDDNEE